MTAQRIHRDQVEAIDQPVQKLACISDVHGNTAALDAVLGSPEFAQADAVAVLGCLTPGPDPHGVLKRCDAITIPTYYLAGNGERAILEMAAQRRPVEREVDRWLLAAHRPADLARLASWAAGLSCRLTSGLTVRLCHGSPRSDVELLTPATPESRLRDAFVGVREEIVVHGHTHLQYQRHAAGRQVVGPGSVGIPHTDGPFGARWALIDERVQLIVTSYDIEDTADLIAAQGYPSEQFLRALRTPVSPAVVIADAEQRQFSD